MKRMSSIQNEAGPLCPCDQYGVTCSAAAEVPKNLKLSTQDVAAAGSLALALARRGLAPPAIWCCAVPPRAASLVLGL